MTVAAAAELWEKATRHLRDVLHPDVFERWIAIIEPTKIEDTTLFVSVDNDFYKTWLTEHYLSLIQNAVTAASDSPMSVSFMVGKQAAPVDPPVEKPAPKKKSLRDRFSRRSKSASPLNDKFTFDDFVVGPCNSFAHAASLAVAQAPARAYNPLFIYGGVGLGKTHLMQAIGHYVQQKSRATVAYVSSEAFMNEYISALQMRALVQFRKTYRNMDLLLIDDIHFLAGKERLQEEFFHTFNVLFDAHKQIVMTSDRPASEIVGLEQRLVSRFEWGLVTELEAPDFETRIAIIRSKLASGGVSVDNDVVIFIAKNIKSNIRRLEGALTRVISYTSLTQKELSTESLQHLLRDMIDEEQQEMLTLSGIQKAVAEHYDVRLVDITSRRRPRAIAVPRQVAMYLCRRMTNASLPEIGSAFAKTHATVLHACRTVERKIPQDETLQRNLSTIAKKLGKNL